MPATIEALQHMDWGPVRDIYAQGMATGLATFETSVPSWEAWDAGHLPTCRLVAREGAEVLGWAALSPVTGRCVYSGVAEVSVYVADEHKGTGVGRLLLESLIAASEAHGIWTLKSGIFPENATSIRLHEACGFRTIGYHERIGRLAGTWRDTVLMERRSSVAGT